MTRFPIREQCPVELTHTSSRRHRTLIVRKLKGLEAYLDVVVVHSFMGALGWSFYPPVRDEEGGFPQTKVRTPIGFATIVSLDRPCS